LNRRLLSDVRLGRGVRGGGENIGARQGADVTVVIDPEGSYGAPDFVIIDLKSLLAGDTRDGGASTLREVNGGTVELRGTNLHRIEMKRLGFRD